MNTERNDTLALLVLIGFVLVAGLAGWMGFMLGRVW